MTEHCPRCGQPVPAPTLGPTYYLLCTDCGGVVEVASEVPFGQRFVEVVKHTCTCQMVPYEMAGMIESFMDVAGRLTGKGLEAIGFRRLRKREAEDLMTAPEAES